MAVGRPISLTPNIATKAISVVATASQTDFTVTGGYRINEIAVYRNGVRLAEGRDFTASDGSTVSLVTGATASDVIEFAVFDSFNVAGTIVSAASSQTVEGDLNITGRLYSGALVPDTFDVGIGTFQTSIHVGTALTANAAGDVETVGIITASSFSGDGSNLTNVGMDTSNVVSTATTTGLLNVTGTTDSTSSTTGSVTIAGGLGVAKNVYIGAGLSVAGTLTYEDVTNVDSVGLITAKSGVNITGGEFRAGIAVTIGSAGITTFSNGVHLDGSTTFGKGNAILLENGFENENAQIVNDGSTEKATIVFKTSSGGTVSERLRIKDTGDVDLSGSAAGVSSVTWDASANSLIFKDNSYAKFGDGSDLSIYHNATNSYIDNSTGHLYLRSNTGIDLTNAAGSKTMIEGTNAGEVSLYYNNSKKFETTNDGTVTTGIGTFTGAVVLSGDNDYIQFGAGGDFQQYHDGTNNIIRNIGTRLDIIVNSNETAAVFNPNASVDLYYDNVKTFETIGDGIRSLGSEGQPAYVYMYADEGDDNADKWVHVAETDGTYSLKSYATGSWVTGLSVASGGGSVTATKFLGDGSALTGVGGDTDITSCLFV